jgi:acetyl esterase
MGLVAEWWDYFVYLSKTVAQELGLAVCPWSPIAGGFLAGKYRREGNSGRGEGRLEQTKDHPVLGKVFTSDQNWRIVNSVVDVAKQIGKTFSFLQMTKTISLLLLAVYLCPYPAMCQSQRAGGPQASPDEYAYAQPGGKELKLYVFRPPGGDHRGLPGAVVIFHGGGWNQGTAAWTFGQARYFASLGMAGISVEYRLANGEEVTPFECVADAKAAIQWVRRHAQELNIDAKRIAAYGESAGGLLAAASAITSEDATKEEKDSVPNALVLFSPALNADSSEHFQKMLRPGQDAGAILPELHIRGGMPATIIVTGELDKMPSAAKMAEFCEKMKRTHNRCELHIYPGVGHMLMPAGEDKEERDKASKTGFDAFLKMDLFLKSLGFLPPEPRKN